MIHDSGNEMMDVTQNWLQVMQSMLQQVFQSAHIIQEWVFSCDMTRWEIFQVYYHELFCYTEKKGYRELVLLFQSIIVGCDFGYALFIF